MDFADFSTMAMYEKLPSKAAYVDNLFSSETTVHVRMLEGDVTVCADKDVYFMIGEEGEVYPITRSKFEKTYFASSEPARLNLAYAPVVTDMDRGIRIELAHLAKTCTAKGGTRVYAVRLLRGLLLFTKWDTKNYTKGEAGDWLIVRQDDPGDWYIIKHNRFHDLYRQCSSGMGNA
jgi:hypothetical protein